MPSTKPGENQGENVQNLSSGEKLKPVLGSYIQA